MMLQSTKHKPTLPGALAAAGLCAVGLCALGLVGPSDAQAQGKGSRFSPRNEASISVDRTDLPDEYIVEHGDTLWDLCEHFHSDPWVWPTVWALNPHVTNPHWIYPGDLLRMRMPNGASPGSPGGLPALSFTLNSAEASHVSSQEGFIVEEPIEEVGSVHRSPYDAAYLGDHTIAYLRLNKLDEARPGDKFTIYRVVRDVMHPQSGDLVGQKVIVLGVAEVLSIDKHYARARLNKAFQEMVRGDKLMPLRKHHQRISPKQNLIDLEAVLVDDLLDLQELAQAHMVIIDRGEKDGIQVGNRLFVLRQADGHLELDEESVEKLPSEQIGEVMVLETQDRSATALVTRSARELRRGDRLVMERNY